MSGEETVKETKNSMETLLKKQVREFLETIPYPFEENVQILDPERFEPYDFWFPEQQIGIDVNDYKHHNQSAPLKNAHLLSKANYHRDKVLEADKHGHKLIILWQNWLLDEHKWPIIENIIEHTFKLHKKSIFARKCEVRFIDRNSPEVRKFYTENALFGHNGGTYAAGLYYEGELVMAMTNRFKPQDRILLCERMAAKRGYNIVGGVSKLIKFFEKNIDFDSWEFFIVLDYGVGNGLTESGFVPIKTQTTLMQYQVAEDYAVSRGRGSYREFVNNIAAGVEARVYYAGTRKYVKENPYKNQNLDYPQFSITQPKAKKHK